MVVKTFLLLGSVPDIPEYPKRRKEKREGEREARTGE